MPRHNHRAAAEIAKARLSDTQAAYDVTMTNGSGTRHIVMNGTQRSCWIWACRAGEQPGNLLGYVPVDIRPVGISEGMFALV